MQRQGPLLSSFLLHLFTGRRERGPRLPLTTLPPAVCIWHKHQAWGHGSGSIIWLLKEGSLSGSHPPPLFCPNPTEPSPLVCCPGSDSVKTWILPKLSSSPLPLPSTIVTVLPVSTGSLYYLLHIPLIKVSFTSEFTIVKPRAYLFFNLILFIFFSSIFSSSWFTRCVVKNSNVKNSNSCRIMPLSSSYVCLLLLIEVRLTHVTSVSGIQHSDWTSL